MGLFGKKKGENKKEGIPSLAELPKLPELDSSKKFKEEFHQLPNFPSSSLGKKFSQDSIKEAVKGEDYDHDFESFNPEDIIEGSLKKPQIKELEDEVEAEEMVGQRGSIKRNVIETEPIFIRIDKFEDAMRIFNDTKRQLSEIESILGHVKKIKEDEEKEIKEWENNLKNMKSQIEKVDRDIFSKI